MAQCNALLGRIRCRSGGHLLLLLLLILLLSGCIDDGDSNWTVTVNTASSSNPTYVGYVVDFSGSYSASGTEVDVISSSWAVTSGPGSYVLNSSGANASGSFYSRGTYVIVYSITYLADDGTQNTSTSTIYLSVGGGAPG